MADYDEYTEREENDPSFYTHKKSPGGDKMLIWYIVGIVVVLAMFGLMVWAFSKSGFHSCSTPSCRDDLPNGADPPGCGFQQS
jgi:cytochrome b subunit of formate dehydrogenase